MTELCPCGSHQAYADCCQKVHLSHAAATTPEQLMRARYSAHVLGFVDFIVDTYHHSRNASQFRDAIADSLDCQWCGLEVVSSGIASCQTQGHVEFKAGYIEAGKQYYLHERSQFVLEDGRWYYLDGEFNQANHKCGRNDPCPCGSGKKYKKCCS